MQQIPSKLTLAKYVQRIADELKDDLCPTNDATTDGGTGPSTERVICTAVRTRGDGDHSITLTIKSPDDMVVVATLELLPHSDQYLAVDHLGRDIMAVDYMSKDPVLVLPKPVQILNEGSDMAPFAPQSRRDSIWMQVRRPDTSRVNPFEGKSDPYYDFNRKHSWLRHGGRYVQGARTILVLVGPKNNDMPFLSVAYANTERSRVWVDFLHPIAPLQAFAIALTAMDRHRRVLKARDGP
ncbi:hypothetical protein DYB28_014611 [Aphanomyces astaci]|uniref:Uncharacterized protein n=1 Tax=Aphanomyces astaci TaxID=112090 RepID=A0A9X8H976_APHAT|nr:hypothetical protein DYB28_014611 [Aphanomyces astaci]